jgi:hypothetical protein
MASCAGAQSCICTILREVEFAAKAPSIGPAACDAKRALASEP